MATIGAAKRNPKAIVKDLEVAVEAGELLRHDLDEAGGDQTERLLFIHPEIRPDLERLERTPAGEWARKRGERQTAYAQLVGVMDKFVAGDDVDSPFPWVEPIYADDDNGNVDWTKRSGVWEIKCSDVRLFGVFLAPGVFLALEVELADALHGNPAPQQVAGKRHGKRRHARHSKCRDRALERLSRMPFGINEVDDGAINVLCPKS